MRAWARHAGTARPPMHSHPSRAETRTARRGRLGPAMRADSRARGCQARRTASWDPFRCKRNALKQHSAAADWRRAPDFCNRIDAAAVVDARGMIGTDDFHN